MINKNLVTSLNKKASVAETQKDKKKYDERCCQTGCEGCPYGYESNLDPDVPTELQIENLNQQTLPLNIEKDQEKYLEIADQ